MRLRPGLRLEKRKGVGFRARFYKPALVKWMQKKPTAVYEFYYERPDGEFRIISTSTGTGRFKRGKESEGMEIAARRLGEQFGEELRRACERDGIPCLLDSRPDLHQDNYELKRVTRR
jgi:hypothetical protein